jgi:pimeloyl-ACP methyl ester carboxylesterase
LARVHARRLRRPRSTGLRLLGGLGKILGGAVMLVALLVVGALGYRAIRQHQRAAEMALHGPHAIQEGRYVRIGGVDQWISIRGQDMANPVILVVHGGPGGSMIANGYFLRGWEKEFTLVEWDQRGAGKTFARLGVEGSGKLSADGIAKDGVEVAQWVERRLGQRKVILLGHSWGTIVGSQMARLRPDLFSAYVATGVVVEADRGEQLNYDTLQRRLKAEGDAKALAKLAAIPRPPYTQAAQVSAERALVFAHPAPSERTLQSRVNSTAVISPDFSLKDLWAHGASQQYSVRVLYPEIAAYSAYAHGTTFQMPVFIIQGDEDMQTPAVQAQEYFERITAPSKRLVLLAGGGHRAFYAMPDQFLSALLTYVRPVALQAR